MRRTPSRSGRRVGFTLIELMVVILIIGILESLFLLPILDQGNIYNMWNFNYNVWYNGAIATVIDMGTGPSTFFPAQTEIPAFYCPSRRRNMNISQFNNCIRINPNFTGGGNDYG